MRPNRNTPSARMMRPTEPIPVSKADRVSVAPSRPLFQTPVMRMTMQVIVQTTKVSTKTSKMPIMPCLTG